MTAPDPLHSLLALHLEPWVLAQVKRALCATHEQYREQGGELSHGAITEALARGQQVPHATRWGALVDLLHAAVDLADNLADEEEDRAAGRGYADHYAKVPRATLLCLPTLMVSAASAEAATLSAERAGEVLTRLTRALGHMAHGQGLPSGHRQRPALVSGAFGVIYALPLFARSRPRRAEAAARWGEAICALGHRKIAAQERPGRASERALVEARDEAAQLWPRFAPFREGEALSAERLLRPRGPMA